MQTIWNLIKLDIITMNGGKNNTRFACVLMVLVCGGVGFVFSPIFGLYCPMIMGGFFVPMLFHNEIKYHSEKLHSLLPISRRDLVNARYTFIIVLYTLMFLMMYLVMLLAQHLKLSQLIMGEDAKLMDIIGLIVNKSNGAFTEFGLFNLLYFSAYAFGLLIATSSLKKYFRDSEDFSNALSIGKITKAQKKEYMVAVVIIAIVLLWFLVLTGALQLGTAVVPLLLLFIQLAQAADGFLLGALMVSIAIFVAIDNYIGTLLEYEEKEL